MIRWSVLLARLTTLALVACGRLGFDPVLQDTTPNVPHVFAYVIDGYSAMTTKTALRIFSVNGDGALAETPSSPFELGAQAENLRGNTAGTRLYVTSGQTTSLYTLAIDAETGSLTLLDQHPTGALPEMIAIHPNGRWLYVPDWSAASRVDGFALDAQGIPSPIAGSPFAFPGAGADWIEIHPNGTWAYVIDNGTAMIHGMKIDAIGALSPLGTPAWPTTDSSPYAALINGTGQFGFVAPDLNGGVPGFTIDSTTGALSTTPGSKFGAIANTCMNAAMDRSRRRLFVADDGSGLNALDAYVVDAATGGLTLLAGSPYPTTTTMWSVATSPVTDDVYTTTTRVGPAIFHFRADDTQVTKIDEYDFPGLDHASRLALVQTP